MKKVRNISDLFTSSILKINNQYRNIYILLKYSLISENILVASILP